MLTWLISSSTQDWALSWLDIYSVIRHGPVAVQARNANIVGILVGTLGVAGYLDAIENLRMLIQKCVTQQEEVRLSLAVFSFMVVQTDMSLFC